VTAEAARGKGLTVMHLSGTKFRQMLRAGEKIPEWFAFESVVRVLREEALREEAAERECPLRSEI
jgi:sulfate adenylyltransferase